MQQRDLSFIVIGDWGRRGCAVQHEVARAMAAVAAEQDCRFVVSTGDNFYEDGVASVYDSHWQESFRDVYTRAGLRLPWYPVLGNHDYRGCPDAQVAYARRDLSWRMGGRWYARSFAQSGLALQMLFLDTTPFLDRYRDGGPESVHMAAMPDPEAQNDWLVRTLERPWRGWRLAVGHHPILSGSPYHGPTPELQDALYPLLVRGGVQGWLCGHEHDLQHLADGRLEHILSGAGAGCRPTGHTVQTCFARALPGFAVITLTPAILRLAFHDAAGRRLYETEREPAESAGRRLSRV